MNLDALKNLNFRDPRILMRLILGLLLIANLVAFYFVIYPLGGAPEELDAELQTLVARAGAQRKSLDRLRLLTTKVEGARRQAGDFEANNFTDRRVVYSTLVNEITQAADGAGIKLKDHALQNEEIEGSDTLGMITVNANYEGTYGDLLNFVNRLDRSEKFVIIDSLAATPQQGSNQLNVTMKMNLFVRNTADLVLPTAPGKAGKPAPGATPEAPSSMLPGTELPISGVAGAPAGPEGAAASPTGSGRLPAPGGPSTGGPNASIPNTGGPNATATNPAAPLPGSRALGTPPMTSPPMSSPLRGSSQLGTAPAHSPLPGSPKMGSSPNNSPLPGSPLPASPIPGTAQKGSRL